MQDVQSMSEKFLPNFKYNFRCTEAPTSSKVKVSEAKMKQLKEKRMAALLFFAWHYRYAEIHCHQHVAAQMTPALMMSSLPVTEPPQHKMP